MSTAAEDPPYGPNTAVVRRFLLRLAGLPAERWEAALARYAEAQGTAAFAEADYGLGAAIEASGRERARDAIVGPLVRLAAAARGPRDELAAEAALAAALEARAHGLPTDGQAGEVAAAVAALGEITGENATEDLLDAIFSRFCIGK